MSVDGANLGIPGEEAARIGGGRPKERMTKPEMLAKVLATADDYAEMKSYNDGCYWLAKQFYLLRKEECGDRDYDFTGFMVGWANNCSRWLLDLNEVENPAIVTIG